MTTIVTRAGKGSALTHAEMDANFNNLNNDKIEFAAGTKMVFYQASAPIGWTIDPAITATGMIVVDQSNGGASGGTDNPLLMDKVPAHTHTTNTTGSHSHQYTGSFVPVHSAASGGGAYAGNSSSSSTQVDGNHSHTTLSQTPESNWVPRYNSVIICSKN